MSTTLCIDFSDAQGELNTVVSGWISLKSKPIQVYMHVLISCKNEADPIKCEGTRVFTTFLPCKSMGIFFSDAPGQLTPQSMFGSC